MLSRALGPRGLALPAGAWRPSAAAGQRCFATGDLSNVAKVSDKTALFEAQKSKKEAAPSHDVLKSISHSMRLSSRTVGPRIMEGDDAKHVPWDDPLAGLTAREASDFSLHWVRVLRNLPPAKLYEEALAHEKGSHITSAGALATLSGAKTGRTPKDKRVVVPEGEDIWLGKGSPNIPLANETFLINRERALDYLQSLDRVYLFDGFASWPKEHRLKIRVITSRAYHALFMRNMLIVPTNEELEEFTEPDFTIYNAGAFPANRLTRDMTSSTSVDMNFESMELVILGTQYAGEMKKGVFTLMHYLMPKRGLLSLHSGCNMKADGSSTTLFFGLSGTGKTTLSTDPARPLIGDDEHVWSDDGVFNIEGGCYAKAVDLDPQKEKEIFNAIRFGTVLENVIFDEDTHVVDFHNTAITENTRVCYPVQHIDNAHIPCVGPHPRDIILLCCDAFGVLPPVSHLTKAQAMYHFISGYTAKVAGTEEGVKEPEATFSACFGGAFLVWHPLRYAAMLGQQMSKHGADAWLVNTGWTGGAYGVGKRMSLPHTRAIIDAIHGGQLEGVEYGETPVFGLRYPKKVPGVPDEVLNPEHAWADKAAHAKARDHLASLFNDNFADYTGDGGEIAHVSPEEAAEIFAAGPKAGSVGK